MWGPPGCPPQSLQPSGTWSCFHASLWPQPTVQVRFFPGLFHFQVNVAISRACVPKALSPSSPCLLCHRMSVPPTAASEAHQTAPRDLPRCCGPTQRLHHRPCRLQQPGAQLRVLPPSPPAGFAQAVGTSCSLPDPDPQCPEGPWHRERLHAQKALPSPAATSPAQAPRRPQSRGSLCHREGQAGTGPSHWDLTWRLLGEAQAEPEPAPAGARP
ncbi:predicted GPI-anchored protein 58 isoform X2 [Choloepus didactylus]|uniref:predicted GPI-anchored protein 58 isoform X2 n=1 Tax=Choloepus didactylus TaxID=27675 RepID=UPI00189C9528|nr:predicted GPI-anchored protein 58 isoform X2 [Choloepus didactylus]